MEQRRDASVQSNWIARKTATHFYSIESISAEHCIVHVANRWIRWQTDSFDDMCALSLCLQLICLITARWVGVCNWWANFNRIRLHRIVNYVRTARFMPFQLCNKCACLSDYSDFHSVPRKFQVLLSQTTKNAFEMLKTNGAKWSAQQYTMNASNCTILPCTKWKLAFRFDCGRWLKFAAAK